MDRYLVFCSIVALFMFLSPLGVNSQSQNKVSCSTYMRCSTFAENTYGLIGNTCGIYRNPCLLALENCDREVRNEALIVPTTKDKCKPLCPSICPLYIAPLCGEYMNQKRTFNNECEMKRYNCKNEKTYLLYSQGMCQ